jgi:3D-(3,5/4)-trihydroxycyclohexane-1,2-dione acylhydrolase (decyclizing)
LLQAELEEPDALPYVLGRNEQALVHIAVAYARMKDRLQTYAISTSVGPGATNMLTGAALATINRLPVLLLPADTFADRSASPLLQELELPGSGDVTVNDAFRPVSRYFDRIWRPEQLPGALLAAMRVLTDPAETGAVTLCFPQDVQAEAYDWPTELFDKRVWHVGRPLPERSMLEAAAAVISSADRPLIVAGGGVTYSRAQEALAAFCEATGIPVGQSQAGKGTLVYDHPQCLGAIGSTGTTAANAIAREADVVIGIGTRYSDFTTASRTAFQNPDVRFVNINVAGIDAIKNAGLVVQADARESLTALLPLLQGYRVNDDYVRQYTELDAAWDETVQKVYLPATPNAGADGLLTQNEVIGMVNELSDARDVVVCAAGSMPGDLHKLWRTRDPKGYHVEYGYSCMGYEVAGGLGIRLACPDRDVFVMVGDGSYLMMATELVTAVQEDIKIITVLVQNHGYASIGSLSEFLGSQRFGTQYRYRNPDTGRLDGDKLPVDLAANAASLGVEVIRTTTAGEFAEAVKAAKAADHSIVIYVETDPLIGAPDSESWWDVPVNEVSTLESTQQARKTYDEHKATQKLFL